MPDTRQSKGLKARFSESPNKKATKQSDGEAAVLAAIAAMPGYDHAMGERLHAVINASAPGLSPKLWYGTPAYAKDGKVICFFRQSHSSRPATGRAPSVDARRYFTFGFSEAENLNEGTMWPIAFAVTKLTRCRGSKNQRAR